MINVKIDRNLDRYIMKEDLLARGSDLRETNPSQLEIVNPGVSRLEGLATAAATTDFTP